MGVPQGSILGPLLFIIFINYLPLVATHSEIDMYADDSTVTSTAKTTEEINGHLNTDMKEITKWCIENRVSANATKTKSMLITSCQNDFPFQKIRETFLYLSTMTPWEM